MPVFRGVDQGREGPQAPPPEPLPPPLEPLPWRNYGGGGPRAYVPMEEPMPGAPRALEPFRLLLLPYDVQQQYRLRRGYAAPDVPDDEILDGVLHDVYDRASTWQRLWQGLKTRPALLAAPLLGPALLAPALLEPVGRGVVRGAFESVRRVRDPFAESSTPYQPASIAEAMGSVMTAPPEGAERDWAPFLAVPGLGGPMRAVKTGYEGAVAGAVAARAAAEAGRAVAGARRAVAGAPGIPSRARLPIAGRQPIRGAATPPGFATEREAIEHLNTLLADLDETRSELAGLESELGALREMRAAGQGKVPRPPWAVGLSDEELRAVAAQEGVDINNPAWYDAIDSKVIREARQGAYGGAQRAGRGGKTAREQQLRTTIFNLRDEERRLDAAQKQLTAQLMGEPPPRIGGTGPAVQAGMGIGERPAQGTLMAAQGAPDITPPLTKVPARPVPGQAALPTTPAAKPLTPLEEEIVRTYAGKTSADFTIRKVGQGATAAWKTFDKAGKDLGGVPLSMGGRRMAEGNLRRYIQFADANRARLGPEPIITEAAGAPPPAPPAGGLPALPPGAAARWGGPPSRAPGMGGAGWQPPPVGPPLPAPGSAIKAHLARAQALVERDRPGLLTRLLDYLPGTRQLLRKKLLPALAQPEKLTAAWIGEGRALTAVATQQALGRRGQFALLERAFGRGALASDFKPKGVKFLGTPEQKAVNAAGDITGMMVDIAERPQLYALSAAQQNALRLAQDPRARLLLDTSAGYNLGVKPYPTQPGGLHVAHVDKSQDAIAVAGSLDAALTRGRLKERLYPTLADRMRADPTFQPVTSLDALLIADDATLARAAGKETFLEGSGGLTRLEMMQKTHPELAAKMDGLKKRLTSLRGALSRLDDKQAQAIDEFLASPLEELKDVRQDLTDLQAALNPKIKRPVFVKKGVAGEPDVVRVLAPGPHFGKDIETLEAEIQAVKGNLEELRPAWRLANPKPYSLVQEAGYRYFPGGEAQMVRELRQTSNNAFLRFLDDLRATAFGGDFSPVTIQGMTWLLANPVGAARMIAEGKFAFSEAALVRDMQARPEFWLRFGEWTGINPLGGVGKEFATGFVGKVPKIGKHWEAWNEALYRPLVRAQAEIFDASYRGALRLGRTELVAGAIATDDAMKLIPRIDYRRLGMSSALMDTYRPLLTSVSFLTQPALLMNDAAKGLLKVGLKMTVTPNEVFAMQRVLTLVATTEALSVASNVLYAQQHGLDVMEAVKESLNPDSGKFMSLIFPNGSKIGLGGPFRAIIRGVAPRKVDWSPVPVPFAGLSKFAESKVGPGMQVIYQEARNRAYTGEQIRTGGFFVSILQGLQYALEGSLPLTVGETARDIRKGVSPAEVGVRAATQFAGTNYVPETLSQTKDRVAAQMYPIDPEKEPWRQAEPYLGLMPGERAKVREHPLVKEQIDAQIDYRGKSDETIRAAREQHFDSIRVIVDYAAESYMKAGKARAAGTLGRKDFRDRIKEIAAVKREGIMALVRTFKAFAEEHRLEDWEEIAPDAVLRAEFLARYNDPNLFDQASGDWDYNRREAIRETAAEEFGRGTVEEWLREGARETHPLVQAWWDGLEAFRPYFQMRQEMLARAPQELRQEITMLEAASRTSEAAVYAILQKSASPEAVKWERTIAGMKRELRRTVPGLDAWLFDYGYTNAPVGER